MPQRRRLRDKDTPAPSRIGSIPTYGLPAASGASTSGYDSLNRKRRSRNIIRARPGRNRRRVPAATPPMLSNAPLRLSVPPSETANKTPIPPAMAGTVAGQPPRKRLRIDDDPFGAVGDYAGSFLIKSAVELGGGYDTNPARPLRAEGIAVLCGRAGISRGLRLGAPRCWSPTCGDRSPATATPFRRRPTARSSSAPVDLDRPDFIGHVDGRLDVSHDTRLLGTDAVARLDRQSRQPERPGRPRQISGLYDVRRHLRRRSELQPPAAFRRRHRRPHRLSRTRNSPTALDQQRRPQLQSVRRPRRASATI